MSGLSKLAAAALAGALLCAAPAMAQTGAVSGSAAVAPDPAKVAIVEQILINMHMLDSYAAGARRGVFQEESLKDLPQADKDRLIVLINEAVERHRPTFAHASAVENVGSLSMEQLTEILKLTKIKYFQDTVLAAADPTLPPADESTMTAEESAFVDKINNEAYVVDFFDNIKTDAADAEFEIIIGEAFDAFQAEQKTT